MKLRQATAADLAAILALETAFPARQRWSETMWDEELSAADRQVLVAELREVAAVATIRLSDGVADLNRIIVAEDQRKLGYGAALLSEGIQWATGRGATRMLLEVRADNAAARRMYDRLGFTKLACRSDYYEPGVDAVVMQLTIREGLQ